MEDDIKTLILHYFHIGYENRIILDFLKLHHVIQISLATLKRRQKDYGLTRRANIEDDLIKQEIQ